MNTKSPVPFTRAARLSMVVFIAVGSLAFARPAAALPMSTVLAGPEAMSTAAIGPEGTWLVSCSLRVLPLPAALGEGEMALILGRSADPRARSVGVYLGASDGAEGGAKTAFFMNQERIDPFEARAREVFAADRAYRFQPMPLLRSVEAARSILGPEADEAARAALEALLAGLCPDGVLFMEGDVASYPDIAERVIRLSFPPFEGSLEALRPFFPEGARLALAEGGVVATLRGPYCDELLLAPAGRRRQAAPVVLLGRKTIELEADFGVFWTGEPPARLAISFLPDSPTGSAQAFLGSRLLGEAPGNFAIRERVYAEELRIEAQGVVLGFSLTVDGPEDVELPIRFDAEERRLSLQSSPPGARASVAGGEPAATPTTLSWRGPRAYLRVEAPDRETYLRELELPPGDSSLRVRLRRDESSPALGVAALYESGLTDSGSSIVAGFAIADEEDSGDGFPGRLLIHGTIAASLLLEADETPAGVLFFASSLAGLPLFDSEPLDLVAYPLELRYGLGYYRGFTLVGCLGSGLGLSFGSDRMVLALSGSYLWLSYPESPRWSFMVLVAFR